ncbi:MAG: thiol:disulfide interchange protein DsbA/DsbL [Pseudomonadota bacterium]
MQRREFSLSAATVAAASLGGALALPGVAQAQGKPPQEGTDYLLLDKPVPTEAPAGKIEVVEFFWYSCPHCNRFEPQLEAWLKKLPKDVSFRRAPVSFRPDFEPQQKLYYTLEALGKVDEMQMKVFNAIHNEKQQLTTADQILAWVGLQPSLNKAKFAEAYNSFPVATKVRKATQLQDQYKVQGVPALGIAGRFYTDGTQATSMERALVVTDYLIAGQRKK